jgi:hypothetical protein
MNNRIASFSQRIFADESGQVLPWVLLGMTMIIGTAGMSIDLGHAYVVHAQLQNDANAAALAAAGQVYVSQSQTSTATTTADSYSGSSGDKNSDSALGTVTTTVSTVCLNALEPSGETCTSTSPSNAVKVKETTTVPTYLLQVLGISNIPVAAYATSTMGGLASQWNIAIIIDSTESMSTTDANCNGLTEFQCAQGFVASLLASTPPCAAGQSTCTTAQANVRVSLFTFPNVTTATVVNDVNCSGINPTTEPYTLPLPSATSYSSIQYSTAWTGGTANAPTGSPTASSTNWTATYQIVPFSSDYYQPSTTNGLNAGSDLVKAIGASSGCPGMQNPGGESTYYAGAIYAAQAALTAEQAANPNSKNAIILLSDGEANAAAAKFPFGQGTAMTTPVADGLSIATTNGDYPDATLNECQQAIMAGQAAAAAGTRVYTVAYGSEDDGCAVSGNGATVVDTSLLTLVSPANVAFTLSSLLPCVTMENIASSMEYFYSNPQQSGANVDTSCVDTDHTALTLPDIGAAIATTFTTPRLIPNSLT